MRPIADAFDQTVFHGIDVAIFDMARVIDFIADQVLPKSDAAFAARDANVAEPLPFWKGRCKTALDQPPPHREIAIVRRQGPDRMQMLGQHHEGIDREGMIAPRRGDRLAQQSDLVDAQGFAAAPAGSP
jgi:hypothetical protein